MVQGDDVSSYLKKRAGDFQKEVEVRSLFFFVSSSGPVHAADCILDAELGRAKQLMHSIRADQIREGPPVAGCRQHLCLSQSGCSGIEDMVANVLLLASTLNDEAKARALNGIRWIGSRAVPTLSFRRFASRRRWCWGRSMHTSSPRSNSEHCSTSHTATGELVRPCLCWLGLPLPPHPLLAPCRPPAGLESTDFAAGISNVEALVGPRRGIEGGQDKCTSCPSLLQDGVVSFEAGQLRAILRCEVFRRLNPGRPTETSLAADRGFDARGDDTPAPHLLQASRCLLSSCGRSRQVQGLRHRRRRRRRKTLRPNTLRLESTVSNAPCPSWM